MSYVHSPNQGIESLQVPGYCNLVGKFRYTWFHSFLGLDYLLNHPYKPQRWFQSSGCDRHTWWPLAEDGTRLQHKPVSNKAGLMMVDGLIPKFFWVAWREKRLTNGFLNLKDFQRVETSKTFMLEIWVTTLKSFLQFVSDLIIFPIFPKTFGGL